VIFRPQLWLVGGPKGAGKTTLVQRGPLAELLPEGSFLNPDEQTLALLKAKSISQFSEASKDVLTATFIEAAQFTFQNAQQRLAQGETICVETVLSTEKYRALVESVIAAGGDFYLIYISLRSPEIACQRVHQRSQLGGHDVPPEKTRERWHRSLEKLP
jgi:predicted ABC-type ATPase